MVRAAVLGAGYMGSAITFPLTGNGVEVNLWGTWLDDEIVGTCKKGEHPKLKKRLQEHVSLYYSDELHTAVADVDFIIIAVTSEGFIPVFDKMLDTIEKPSPLFSLTKGLLTHKDHVERISKRASSLFQKKFNGKKFLWTSIGGPVKAVELSAKVPTATIFGINSPEIKSLIHHFTTDYYYVFTCDDVKGVELASAFKNVYAIALGIYDGLYQDVKDRLSHNLKSLLYNQSLREMALLALKAGGKRETVFDLAGIGDLYVTSASGRNRRFGELIGKGMDADEAYNCMLAEDEAAEGYSALKLGMTFIEQIDKNFIYDLPLFNMLYRIIYRHHDMKDEISRFLCFYKKM